MRAPPLPGGSEQRNKLYDYHTPDCLGHIDDWLSAGLAVQPGMGLRSQWWIGHNPPDSARPLSPGNYMSQAISFVI
jgi:hypothetical protein